jgi:hypothetical protein
MRPGVALLLLCCRAGADAPQVGTERFSLDEVRVNVGRFLGTLFGPKEPTLADYNLFHGGGHEDEYDAEVAECERRWGADPQIAPGQPFGAECRGWLVERSKNADTVPSLYYRALRAKLALEPRELAIFAIEDTGRRTTGYRVVVEDRDHETRLELYHAADPQMTDLGIVRIVRVNEEGIAVFLAGR